MQCYSRTGYLLNGVEWVVRYAIASGAETSQAYATLRVKLMTSICVSAMFFRWLIYVLK